MKHLSFTNTELLSSNIGHFGFPSFEGIKFSFFHYEWKNTSIANVSMQRRNPK